jgi:hypothetical protein
MDSCALGVHDSFGDALPVELGEFVNEVVVLEQNWPQLASSHGVLVVVDGHAHRGGHLLRHFLIFIITQTNQWRYFN